MGHQEERSSLFAAISEGLASQEQTARLQRLEIALGLLAFFTIVSLIATVVAELDGQLALAEALVSAAFVGLSYVVYRRWRRVGAAVAADIARRRGGAERG